MSGRRGYGAAAGFTLIELLVTMTVLAVLLRLAVPSFSSAMLTSRLASQVNAFVGSVQFARSEAIKRNTAVTLCASADGSTCAGSGTWAQGWIVACPADSPAATMCNAAGVSQLVLQRTPALAAGYSFTSPGGPMLTFPASGVGVGQTTLTLCRARPQPGEQERQITVAATGRTAVVTTRTGTCP